MPTLRLTMTALALTAALVDPLDRAIAAVFPLGPPPRTIAHLLDVAAPPHADALHLDDAHVPPARTDGYTFAVATITGGELETPRRLRY
jgi:hypothetical protein